MDALSKYAWVVGWNSKSASAVRNGLQLMLEQGRVPCKLQTDEGKEFHNETVKRLLKEYGIDHYSTRGEPKASMVERFNRTLKEMTYKYMTAHNRLKYLDALPELVATYNRRVHSATGLAPVDVNERNASVVWRRLLKPTVPTKAYKFREGDFVRTSKVLGKERKRGAFGVRGFKEAWSKAVYTVVNCGRQFYDGLNYYKLEDWKGKEVRGRFYEPHLQKVKGLPNRWRVAKKLKYRGRGANRLVLVNWQGLTKEFKTWIKHKELKEYE